MPKELYFAVGSVEVAAPTPVVAGGGFVLVAALLKAAFAFGTGDEDASPRGEKKNSMLFPDASSEKWNVETTQGWYGGARRYGESEEIVGSIEEGIQVCCETFHKVENYFILQRMLGTQWLKQQKLMV